MWCEILHGLLMNTKSEMMWVYGWLLDNYKKGYNMRLSMDYRWIQRVILCEFMYGISIITKIDIIWVHVWNIDSYNERYDVRFCMDYW